ncbi:hypothetical protein F5884DRAFT_361201 [Xylogone sp. PMI_703]|nr:hypothetical protein F5884DRAFT_361201 [Xylogone sp. PMI_703]
MPDFRRPSLIPAQFWGDAPVLMWNRTQKSIMVLVIILFIVILASRQRRYLRVHNAMGHDEPIYDATSINPNTQSWPNVNVHWIGVRRTCDSNHDYTLDHCQSEDEDARLGARIVIIVLITGGFILLVWLFWRLYLHIQQARTASRLFVQKVSSADEEGESSDKVWSRALVKAPKRQPLLPEYIPYISNPASAEMQAPRIPSLVLPNPKFRVRSETIADSHWEV